MDDLTQRAAGRRDPVATVDERTAEQGARYIDFLIPGLAGLNLMSSSMWGIGYLILDMRTKKLIKRMLATPMRKRDFGLSFLIMQVAFVLVGNPFSLRLWTARLPASGSSGSPLLLLGLCLLGAFAFGGLGMFVASRAQNTQTVGGLIEPRHDADVYRVRSVLLHGQLPRSHAALSQPPTPYRPQRRNARDHQRGGSSIAIAMPIGILVLWGVVSYARSNQAVSVDLMAASSGRKDRFENPWSPAASSTPQ